MKKVNLVPGVFPVLCLFTSLSGAPSTDPWVDGELIEFKQNGAWCWFQDERAVVDTVEKKLIIGSTGSGSGSIDVTIYDLEEKKIESSTQVGNLSSDDHNAPALLIRPDGNYLAMFADHYDRYNSHYSICDNGHWSYEKKFDWQKTEGFDGEPIAYSNLFYLAAEGRTYDFARANNQTPNFLFSEDYGDTWKFGGRLSTDPSSTYNKGYYKYWSNGVDRIDFCNTQQHPRDTPTSIYHGFIKDGKTHNSFGEVVDGNVYDIEDLPTKDDFTTVFANDTVVKGMKMTRCWQSDICRYEDSTIAILFKARADNSEFDHRNFYARFDGDQWQCTYIGKAGKPMYSAEEDYTGLGALCPDDPNTIYISSPFNPGDDDSEEGKREIWRGITGDHGKTWEWSPVTANSTQDNFRPIVPKWNVKNTALLWFRGEYTKAQEFTTNVVGVLYHHAVETESLQKRNPVTGKALSLAGRSHRSITLRYSVPDNANTSLRVFSLSGKCMATLVNRNTAAGTYAICWNTESVSKGIYLCMLNTGRFSRTMTVEVW